MTDLTELLRSAEPLTEPGFDAHDVARRVHQRRARRRLVTATTTAAVVGIIAVLGTGPADLWRRPSTRVVLSQAPAAFVGTWVSTDTDGSSQTMEIVRSGGDEYGVVARDEAATAACSDAPSTVTGTGLLETDEILVIAQPELTCDDGTTPAIGPPPQAQLANFTLEFDTASDEFVDSFGVLWRRAGSSDESATSGGMWPQSTLDEVRTAQERADAGDPAYTWQLDAKLAADEEPWGAEIFARFIEEELGWEEFAGASFAGHLSMGVGGGDIDGVLFIRCAAGKTNPLNPLYDDAPSEIRECAPTIDEHTYETVRLRVKQPGLRGPSGIWVVNRWEIQQSKHDPSGLYELLSPDYLVDDPGRVEQVTPPRDADVMAFLRAFLRARVEGEGAAAYLLREPEESPSTEVPLLYATTSRARYERFETQRVDGPVWPTGWTEHKVQLFAEGETVVEQYFHVVRDENGQLGLLYGNRDVATTENGKPVAVRFSEFADTVTFTAAPPPIPRGDGTVAFVSPASSDGRVKFALDPRPDSQASACEDGLTPEQTADASALARSIEADPSFETTEPVPVSIAGSDGLQMDVAFSADATPCYGLWAPDNEQPVDSDARWRMRLHLINHPREWGSSWGPQVLTIAVIAPEADFGRVLEQATPILESLEFHAPG